MNIIIFGGGAIGSLFCALLSHENNVALVGRPAHILSIQKNGLSIKGKTNRTVTITAVESIRDVPFPADLILLTVKSYDTETASRQLQSYMAEKTIVVSLQNGLDNIEKMERFIDKKHILAGVTTYGAIFSKPGEIIHTGMGYTILGELDGSYSNRLRRLVACFNTAGIRTKTSKEIKKEIWSKTIINCSINPLTAFFGCKNGYLLENPLLEQVVEKICMESTSIALAEDISVSPTEMISRTKEVIRNTANNSSSMLQSIQQHKKTEIDSMNAKLVQLAETHRIDASLNGILTHLILSRS